MARNLAYAAVAVLGLLGAGCLNVEEAMTEASIEVYVLSQSFGHSAGSGCTPAKTQCASVLFATKTDGAMFIALPLGDLRTCEPPTLDRPGTCVFRFPWAVEGSSTTSGAQFDYELNVNGSKTTATFTLNGEKKVRGGTVAIPIHFWRAGERFEGNATLKAEVQGMPGHPLFLWDVAVDGKAHWELTVNKIRVKATTKIVQDTAADGSAQIP